VTVAPPSARLLEIVIEALLVLCTFGFGWVGWWIMAWADAQTPAKLVLHTRVVRADDGTLASFGRMALREALGKGFAAAVGGAGLFLVMLKGQPVGWVLVSLAGGYGLGNVVLVLLDPRRQTLWDRLAATIVITGDPVPFAVTDGPVAPPPPVFALPPPPAVFIALGAEGSERT
jgi:uncharacterized RDD family membrane protein YckC